MNLTDQPPDLATCPHKHASIRQWYVSANVFEIRDGNHDDFGRHRAIPTGMIGITCHDCWLNEDYLPGKVPPWLADRVQAILADLKEESVGWW